MDVQDQRVRFVVAASRREKSLSALCAEFGISRPTGALWIERYAEAGLAGIAERSRRPRHSLGQTPWESEERVIALRLKYPDWGARKLEGLLRRQGVDLTRSTIHRILLRYDLVRDQDRHEPAVKRFEPGAGCRVPHISLLRCGLLCIRAGCAILTASPTGGEGRESTSTNYARRR